MKTIVISQPMFFPWVGLFEQVKLADIFVHFNDVQLPQGRSFTNRVQIKTKDGVKWLTVPLRKMPSGTNINEAMIAYDNDWVEDHIKFLEGNYSKAPHKNDMLQLVANVYDRKFNYISELDIFSIETVCDYFDLKRHREFHKSSTWQMQTKKSERLLDIIDQFKAGKYVTGWGAMNYLDYDLFDRRKVLVEFMNYNKSPYTQAYGDFNPFVSILDLIAYEGKEGMNYINSQSMHWKTFLENERNRTI